MDVFFFHNFQLFVPFNAIWPEDRAEISLASRPNDQNRCQNGLVFNVSRLKCTNVVF